MKKLFLYLTAAIAALSVFSCIQPEPEPEYPSEAMAKVAQADLVEAAATAYAAWEEDNTIPASLSVKGTAITKSGELELTAPQYMFALAQAVADIAAGKKDEIIVLGYKPADHPDRDSYDAAEIAVTGGAAIEEGTEDLANLAARFIETAKSKGTIPNQTLVTRKGADPLAFSTNRLTVTMLRALAEYKKGGSFPAKVSTEYLSAAATLKGFAKEFVKVLDIWQNTVGTVSADGSHCTDNNSAWKNVHFVPIPHSGGAYADGVDQYDAKYQPYFTVTIDGTTYTSAQTWGIALRGIVDLITKEGSSKMQQNRNPMEHTLGNGANLKEPIPATIPEDIWGMYPWYESTNDGPAINKTEFDPYLIVRCATWFLTRQLALGKIGNYQFFGTDPDSGFVDEGVSGFVSSMRMWLIAARFYKYLLDNDINENVYDAVKNATFSTDLYGVEMPDIELKENSVSITADGAGVPFTFIAKKDWTATASESWIKVDPASGTGNGEVQVTVSADPNTGDAREGKIVIKGGNVTDGVEVTVSQSKYTAPSGASLKEFAKEFVKGLDVWMATVGTVESESEHLIEKGTAWTDVHFIPIVPNPNCEYLSHAGNQYDAKYTPWVLNVAGQEYTSSQAWEIAIRGLMNMVTAEGEAFLPTMDDRNKAYTLANGQSFSAAGMPSASEANQWGKHPWYEGANSDLVTYNGAPIKEVDVNFMVKVGAWHVVRSFVKTGGNSPLGMVGNFQQFGTASSTLILDGYNGLIAPMRELIILMRIYKYLLDNNVDANVYDALKDQKFDFDMYAQGTPAQENTSLKTFAKEFVKGLDVWAATVGNVDADGIRNSKSEQGAWQNVHYIPIGNTNNSDFKDYGNNQYSDGREPWKFTVAGTEYTSSQAWEIAIRGLLNMCTTEGEAFLDGMTDRNKAYTVGNNLAFSSAPISKPSDANKWGKNPWYEYGTLVTYNGNAIDAVDVNFMLKVGAWHVVRSFIKVGSNNPLGMIGNFQEFGTSSGTLNLDGYVGLISPMRELMVLMRIYKYLLDNNVDGNVYSAIKDQKFDFDLYGEGQGGGTKSIKSADDFIAWAAAADVDAVLEADITLPDTFVPDTLRANFDGKGHTVTYALTYDGSEKTSANAQLENFGLFKVVNGSVKNLKTAGSITFNAAASSGTYHIGGVVGKTEADAVIENCTNAVEILGTTKVTHHMGGIAGFTSAGTKVSGCKNTAAIQMVIPDHGSANASQLGGIIGHIEGQGEVKNCVNDGKVLFSGTGTPRIAGMCGYINNLVDASFIECTNNGDIVLDGPASGYCYIGGISGYYGTPTNSSHVLYKKCVNNGNQIAQNTVSGTSLRIGGILCHCGGTKVDVNLPLTVEVIDCTNTGNITTDGVSAKQHIGSLIAFTETTTCIVKCSGCTTTGNITIAGAGTIGAVHGYSCNPASTYTDFTIGKDVVLTAAEGAKVGMFMGSGYVSTATIPNAELNTAITGEVKGGKIVKGNGITEITADNYKENLVAAGFVGSVDGVKFTGSSSAAVGIKIDGNYDDWANVPSAEPSDAFKAFKVWNDAENFYFYVETDPGSRLWSGGAYLYLYFDWDNNLTTGEYSGTTGMGSNKYEAYTFMYIFENNTVGAPRSDSVAKGLKLDNLKIAGTDSSAAVVKFELSIPRADFDQQVKAGDVIGINSYRSKDGGNVYFPGYVVK